MTQLVTGEAVALDLNLAGLPSRLLARVLDALVQLVALFVLVLGLMATVSDDALGTAVSLVLLVAVVVGYPVLLETLLRGRTVGKMALGLRVVRDDGGPIGFRQAFVRGISGVIDLITYAVPSVIAMLVGERSKRLGDHLAGTVVVLERSPVRPVPPPMMPAPLVGWAQTLQLSGLSDELALAARQFVARSAGMTPDAREALGRTLLESVTAVIAPPPPPGTPGWAVLAAVLAERRRRDGDRLAHEARLLQRSHGALRPSAVPRAPQAAPPPGLPVAAAVPAAATGFAPPA
jgi:uncharacterized RDD family membrane protein YckC